MNYYRNLSEDERRTVRTGLAALVLILLLFLVIFPLKDSRDLYRRRVAAEKKALEEVSAMSSRYMHLKEDLGELRSRSKDEKKDFTLFSFLDEAAADSDVKNRIKAMKPSVQSIENYTESTVIVELEDVALEPLIKYIYLIESSAHNLRIEKVDIKPRYSNPDQIGATIIISSVEMT